MIKKRDMTFCQIKTFRRWALFNSSVRLCSRYTVNTARECVCMPVRKGQYYDWCVSNTRIQRLNKEKMLNKKKANRSTPKKMNTNEE